MLLHYIEDCDQDAKLLLHVARRVDDLGVSIVPSIEDFSQVAANQPVDCVLLDVNRPDAISLTDDVRKVRELTAAPVIFITGGELQPLWAEAMEAGAQSLLDKNKLNADLLKEVITPAGTSQTSATDKLTYREKSKRRLLANYNLNRIGAPLGYLQHSLTSMTEVLADNGFDSSASILSHLSEVTFAIRSFANEDLTAVNKVAVHDIFATLSERINGLARQKNITLTTDIGEFCYSQIGPEEIGLLGIQHLMDGVLRAAPPHSSIHIGTVIHDPVLKLNIHSTQKILPDAGCFFSDLPDYAMLSMDAICSLRLAALLLYLRKEQIFIANDNTGQSITITI